MTSIKRVEPSTPPLTPQDVNPNRVYSAKRPTPVGFIAPVFNDRQVKWVNSERTQVQYDSPSTPLGRHYPKVSMEAFLKWVKEDVTDKMPSKVEWRPVPARQPK